MSSEITAEVGSPAWYKECVDNVPIGRLMRKQHIKEGLGVTSDQIDSMTAWIVAEIPKSATLADRATWEPKSVNFKDARARLLLRVRQDEMFKEYWAVPMENAPEFAFLWIEAASRGLWNLARNQLRKQQLKITTPETESYIRSSPRSRTAAATTQPVLRSKVPSTKCAFEDIRMNFYILGEHEKAFFFRVSSILQAADHSSLSEHERKQITPHSDMYDKFYAIVKEYLMSMDRNLLSSSFSVFHPDTDGPHRIASQGILVSFAHEMDHENKGRWKLVIAPASVFDSDERLVSLCEELRVEEVAAPLHSTRKRPSDETDEPRPLQNVYTSKRAEIRGVYTVDLTQLSDDSADAKTALAVLKSE